MKRTEKIEVRVSLEEKQTLSALAKQEGDSVSALVRGLIDKYMALNAASTKRRLPKWQMAGLLVIAAFVGHGLTLIPIHLHERGHAKTASYPTYMVHGTIGKDAFGVGLTQWEKTQEFTLTTNDNTLLTVNLSLTDLNNDGAKVDVSICEKTDAIKACHSVYSNAFEVERIAPHVVGGTTSSGKNIHLFIQEMAKA